MISAPIAASSKPWSGPNASTPNKATSAIANSMREADFSSRSSSSFTRCLAAIRMIATARTGSGRLRNRPVKKARVSATTIDAVTSESGDVAPFMSFTAVCDMPPDTGKAVDQPHGDV